GDNPADPGLGACGQPLQWCQNAVIQGAQFTTQWAGFSTWTQTGLAFADQPVSFTAGATAGPIDVQLKTGSIVSPAVSDTPVTLTTTSTKGQFSTSPSGPWTSTLTVTIPAGASSTGFYYQDTQAGTPTISATLAGQPPATQVETVVAGAPWTLTSAKLGTVSPATGAATTFTASWTATGRVHLKATVNGLSASALITVRL